MATTGEQRAAPREHGAWVMLYLPLLVGLAAGRPDPLAALLLLVAATALFCGQEAWTRRPLELRRLWPTALAAVCVLALLAVGPRWFLWPLALPAALLGAVWLALPTRRAARRERAGQLLAVALLCLGAPAGYGVATGRLDLVAAAAWLACWAYFAGGVLYVGMLLAAPRSESILGAPARWRAGRDAIVGHAILAVALVAVAVYGATGRLLALGYMPALARLAWRWPRLGPRLKLKQVGLWEAAYAVWFALCAIAALRLAS